MHTRSVSRCSSYGRQIVRLVALSLFMTPLAGAASPPARSIESLVSAAHMVSLPAQPGAQPAVRRDSMTVTIPGMQRVELKLRMSKGQRAEFRWRSSGAALTFNLHGEGPSLPDGKAHVYLRGSSKGETGDVTAVFDGVHGWSFRNTTETPVQVTVVAWGQYSELKKM